MFHEKNTKDDATKTTFTLLLNLKVLSIQYQNVTKYVKELKKEKNIYFNKKVLHLLE